MSFLSGGKEMRMLRPQVLSLYRICLKLIRDLPHQRKVYYDYTRLKFRENLHLTDPKKIKFLVNESEEEIAWVRKVLESRGKPGNF